MLACLLRVLGCVGLILVQDNITRTKEEAIQMLKGMVVDVGEGVESLFT